MEDYAKGKMIEEAMENGIQTIVILEGDAPKQYNNLCVDVTGNIDSPSRFVDKRGTDFEHIDRHCIVNVEEGVITLVIDPQSSTDKHTIVGKIKKSKKFQALGINDSEKAYTPEALHRKLKLMRSYFVDITTHTMVCKELKNLNAKINREIEDHDDEKGNLSQKFRQTVESNIPDNFILSIPLIEGDKPTDITVSINLMAGGTSTIICLLESMDAADAIEAVYQSRVQEEIEKLSDFTVIIEN